MGSNIKEYVNGQALKQLKKDLQSGIKHPNCEWCWKNEKAGMRSHRIKSPRNSGELHSIHIRLNNVCNFKCRMCNPSFSTTWLAENKKHNYFFMEDNNLIIKDSLVNQSYLFDIIKNSDLKHISISGGEPLISDAHYTLLTFLIDNNLTDITLGYSTNLSNLDYKGIDLLSLWEKFKDINLEASVDGWGAAVEYSRTGFNRKTFLENFKRAFKYIDAINCVVNVYSVWTLPYIERFRKYGINIVYSPCYLPAHCNPQILMREDKNKLLELYSSYPHLLEIYKKFIDEDLPDGYTIEETVHLSLDEMRSEMVKYNKLLDSYRDTNFFEIFPQYRKYEN
jgi:uncharacterized Fe-S cluster-containing radical SAM superfamily protein